MAEAADKIMKADKKTINVIAGKQFSEGGEIDAIGSKQGRFAGTKPARGQGSRPGGQNRQKGLCFYHDKHGPVAFKCEGNRCAWASTPLAPKPARSGNGRPTREEQVPH